MTRKRLFEQLALFSVNLRERLDFDLSEKSIKKFSKEIEKQANETNQGSTSNSSIKVKSKAHVIQASYYKPSKEEEPKVELFLDEEILRYLEEDQVENVPPRVSSLDNLGNDLFLKQDKFVKNKKKYKGKINDCLSLLKGKKWKDIFLQLNTLKREMIIDNQS